MKLIPYRRQDGTVGHIAPTPAIVADAQAASDRGEEWIDVPAPGETCECCGDPSLIALPIDELLTKD
jgi:hypothetical protein